MEQKNSNGLLRIEAESKRIIDLDEDEMYNLIFGEIVKPLNIRNQDNLLDQSTIVSSMLRKSFPFITYDEVSVAFALAVSGKLKDLEVFRLLDAINVSKVLNAYLLYKQEVAKNVKPLPDIEQLPPHIDFQEAIDADIELLNEGVDIQQITDLGGTKYEFLIDNNLLEITPQEKRDTYEDAAVLVNDEYFVKFKYSIWTKFASDMEAKKYSKDNPIHGLVVARSKLLLYHRYLMERVMG